MEAGKFIKLKVERESDIGYVLTDGEEEMLLHYNDTDGKKLDIEQMVNVFIYIDHKGRKAATLQIPKITAFDVDWVEVVDVVRFGVFCNIGIKKDILLSEDDLPLNRDLWPQIDDLVYAYIINDNDKGLLIKLANKDDFLDIKQEAPKDAYGKKLKARVIRIGREGINVYTEEGYLGFIHNSEYKEEPRLGSQIQARVIDVKPNGEINLSLIAQKELAMKEDSQIILDYLNSHNGKLPLSDKSTPEQIDDLLGMSKAAFKRAIGKLLKESLITQNTEKNIIQLK